MNPKTTTWPLERHTAIKHEILKRYFQAWLPILSTWSGKVLFIDGFAGPGAYVSGEKGSPVVVLEAARDHSYKVNSDVLFIFVEAREDRFLHLKSTVEAMKATLPKNFHTECLHGNFDERLSDVMAKIDEQARHAAPILAFVDPFGFSQTPFKTISRILQKDRAEVVVTFMYEEINRFIGLPEQAANYDRLFGTSEWRNAIAVTDPEARKRTIHDTYLSQLRKIARYVRSFEMLNRRNRTDYFLFFATNNLRGLEKMKDAMWKVDPNEGSSFSDYTDAYGSLPLFGAEPDYGALKRAIVNRFRGTVALSEEIGDYVVAQTRFLRSHYKRKVLALMENNNELTIVSAKPGRRRGTFPDGTRIKIS